METIRYYEGKLDVIIRVMGEHTMLGMIDARAVDALIDARRGEGVSQHTISKELGALRSLLRHARRRGEYDADPAAVLPENWESGYEPRKRFHTRPQADALMGELTHKRRAIVAYILITGAEWRAVENARRPDFDTRRREVKVNGTKNAMRARVVPILKDVADLVPVALAGLGPEGFEHWGNVRRDLAAACVRAGVPKISPHDLRRSRSKWLRDAGIPPHAIGSFLGHADGRMVERVYGRIQGAELGAVIESQMRETVTKRKAKKK